MTDQNHEEIVKRLEALEAENAQLRQQASGKAPAIKPTTAHISMYKGNPIIRFEGNFRPFGFGLKKASVILDCLKDMKFFVENNSHQVDKAPDHEDPQ